MNIGRDVPDVVGPASLYGVTLSLNMKVCKYLDVESRDRNLHFDTYEPTKTVPQAGHVRPRDLEGIFRALQTGHLVVGSEPIPEFDKQMEVMEEHLGVIKNTVPFEFIKSYISDKIVNGPNLNGGYTKLEILETMLEEEAFNPLTGKGGRNRTAVVDFLKEAIQYVVDTYGGVSKVKSEEIVHDQSSSGRTLPTVRMDAQKASKFLGL